MEDRCLFLCLAFFCLPTKPMNYLIHNKKLRFAFPLNQINCAHRRRKRMISGSWDRFMLFFVVVVFDGYHHFLCVTLYFHIVFLYPVKQSFRQVMNEMYGGDDGYKMHSNAKRPTERREKKREGERERKKEAVKN